MSINNSINNSSLTNHNNTSFSSETKPKKVRKDAKGNLIIKKERKKLKSKFHVNLVDDLIPGKEIADIIEIESYKKYNLESDENVEENQNDKNENKEIKEEKTETKQRCCNIF